MKITINFDMDGTIADLYGVENWLEYLINGNTYPYEIAKPLVKFNLLARRLNTLQKQGYQIAVITWLSRGGTEEYNKAVADVKMAWLAKHLPSVKWDRITIVEHGTPKENYCYNPLDILFDDERHNREKWTGRAYTHENILEVLKEI